MKDIISLFSLILLCNLSHAQNDSDVQYMEVFANVYSTWEFRTNSSDDYQKVGLFGKNMKPYFRQNPEALQYFKKYQRAHVGFVSSNVFLCIGGGLAIYGTYKQDLEMQKDVSSFMISAGILGLISRGIMNKQLYNAVDAINHNKSPRLQSSLVPTIQMSSHNLGLGLVWNLD